MSFLSFGFWFVRVGRMIDNIGISIQGEAAPIYQISKHRRLIPFGSIRPQLQEKSDIFVAPSASVVGDVTVGENSSIWYNSVLRGDMNPISIGNGSSIGENSVLHCSSDQMAKESASPIVIGDNAIIDAGCLLQGCVIQDGAIIGRNSVIAAGSFVPVDAKIPSKQLWGGNPVQYIRDLTQEEVDNLTTLGEERKRLAIKHKNEHMKTADELLDDLEDAQFYFKPQD